MTDPDYFEMARLGTLPADFDQWELTRGGRTVAHDAARYGNLPENFDRWELTDNLGCTVADIAVWHRDIQ